MHVHYTEARLLSVGPVQNVTQTLHDDELRVSLTWQDPEDVDPSFTIDRFVVQWGNVTYYIVNEHRYHFLVHVEGEMDVDYVSWILKTYDVTHNVKIYCSFIWF